MKKSFIYLLLAFFMISGLNVFADTTNNTQTTVQKNTIKASSSPYLDSNNGIITVAELKDIEDGEYITLKGYITKRIKKKKFLFKDSTGEIILEIDKKINNQLAGVNENTLVEIYGEYDREHFEKNKIEVKKITIVE